MSLLTSTDIRDGTSIAMRSEEGGRGLFTQAKNPWIWSNPNILPSDGL